MRHFFLVSLLAVFAFACDPIEETNNDNVNNTNNTNYEICNDNLDNDGDTLTDCLDSDCAAASNCQVNNVNNNNTDPGTCNPEDLPYQALCSVGFKCTITDTADHVGCVYDDGPLAPGEACAPVGPGRTQDGCPGGSLCFAQNGETYGICTPFCAFLYIPCDETSMCYETLPAGSGSAYLCSPRDACDPFALTGCATGACYVYISANYMTKCEPEGTLLKDSPCTRPGECAPRHTCYEDVCRFMCTTHDDCGIEMCQKLSANDPYGLCM